MMEIQVAGNSTVAFRTLLLTSRYLEMPEDRDSARYLKELARIQTCARSTPAAAPPVPLAFSLAAIMLNVDL
jgi:hypothetical protein